MHKDGNVSPLESDILHCGRTIFAGQLLTPGFPDLQSVGTSPQPSSPGEPQGEPPEEPAPKPSKRLIILAECIWASDDDRNLVLKELCERMACDQLDKPFWVRQYFISPVAQTAEGSGTDCCIQYKIHISTPKLEPENSAASGGTSQVLWSPGQPSLLLAAGSTSCHHRCHFLVSQVARAWSEIPPCSLKSGPL